MSDTSKSYVFKVTMTCGGCLESVRRSVNVTLPKKYSELVIDSIDGDLDAQTVTISVKSKSGAPATFPSSEDVLELVKKSGKVASLV